MQGELLHNMGIQLGLVTANTQVLSHHTTNSHVKHVWPIWRCVSMTSSFLAALKEECHTCTDGLIMCKLLPWVLVHLSCHEDKSVIEEVTAKSSIRHQGAHLKQGSFSCSVSGLIARQARYYPLVFTGKKVFGKVWNLCFTLCLGIL
jgi:hypothetical protein